MLKDPLKIEPIRPATVTIPLEWLQGLIMQAERIKDRLDWEIKRPDIKRSELEMLNRSEIFFLLGYIESIQDLVYKE